MKKIIFSLVIIMCFSTTVYSQWTIYQTNTTMQLNKIQFVNENTGFAAGGGAVYNDSAVFFKTTNAGTNWTKYRVYDSTVYSVSEIYGLYFVNENTGFVCGRYMHIYKTTNGGTNWKAYEPPYLYQTQIYNALYFINENTGYAAGRFGYFCKTTNGGENWILTSVLTSNLFGLYFINSNTGFVGAGEGVVFKTTNGGYNFTPSYLGPYSLESIRFISDNTGYVSGYDAWSHSGIYQTTNSGQNWNNILLCNYELHDVFFVNANIGYSSGWNKVLKTTDAGINWYNIIPYSNGYFGLFLINENICYLSGGGGKIYKTTTGGVWINQISKEIPNTFEIKKCYPNPFNSALKVEIAVSKIRNNNSEIFLEVFDIKGSVIFEKELNINFPGIYETNLDFSNLPGGIYFIRVRCENLLTKIYKVILIK